MQVLLRARDVPPDLADYFAPVAGSGDYWEIATEAFPAAHFATYPQELVRRCILAGTSERGCCPECGAAWVRETETSYRSESTYTPENESLRSELGRGRNVTRMGDGKNVTTLGWRPTCECGDEQSPIGIVGTEAHAPVSCTVLDPFFGSGTTGLVARKHGRRTIGIELSPEYCGLAARRLSQLSLLAEPA